VFGHEVNKPSITLGPQDVISIGQHPTQFVFCAVGTKDKTIVIFAIKALKVSMKRRPQPGPLRVLTHGNPVTLVPNRLSEAMFLQQFMEVL